MKYIKTNEEFNLIKSFSDQADKLSWKQIIIGFSIMSAISYYGRNHKLTDDDINDIIDDVDNIPTTVESSKILSIKKDLIENIKQENLDEVKKKKLINAVNTIPFVSIDSETINAIAGNDVFGCYFGFWIDNKFKNVIFFDEESFNDKHTYTTIFHELRHLIDQALEPGLNKYYSETSNIVELLDKDIITQTPIGEKKLNDKIMAFCLKHREIKSGLLYKEMGKKEIDKINTNYKIIKGMLLEKDMLKYLTSPHEVYARFHGLKRFLLKNGYIHSMNDKITQQHIIDLTADPRFLKNMADFDFFELIFYLNIDFTGKTESDMTKANSIVANYNDYLNKKTT